MSEIELAICKILRAQNCELLEEIQSLWSGYGMIWRASIDGESRIVKLIDISNVRQNRRGWGSDFAHRRKVRSYEVEANFYREFSQACSDSCRVATLHGATVGDSDSQWMIVLEDLDDRGYSLRKSDLDNGKLYSCLRWLANFHAVFLNTAPAGLWDIGTYWHLNTRPDELATMQDGPLKEFAGAIDQRLNSANFKTLVHGDAKVANFCFADLGDAVAAVDFQYVGGGCGMKDVAYFISSCLYEDEAQHREEELLDLYFEELVYAVDHFHNGVNVKLLVEEWRDLYRFAWADFYRFLAGWSPGHWKMNAYSKQITDAVIEELR